jgi:hypothetical protein
MGVLGRRTQALHGEEKKKHPSVVLFPLSGLLLCCPLASPNWEPEGKGGVWPLRPYSRRV